MAVAFVAFFVIILFVCDIYFTWAERKDMKEWLKRLEEEEQNGSDAKDDGKVM